MNINFFALNKVCVVLSIILTIATVALFISRGFNLGTEFTGGIELRVDFSENIPLGELTTTINDGGKFNASLEKITSSDLNTVVIRHALIEDSPIKTEDAFSAQLAEKFGEGYDITQTTLVGSTVGSDNTINAIILSLVVIAAIVGYLTLRFKFLFGLSAILAVLHDVTVMIFVILLFNLEINVLVIVAILTIFGYSVNDNIIFFDRVREETRHYHSTDYRQLLHISINNVFVRTLITSITTLIVVSALFISTEGAYREFGLLLIIGIISGSYSSIYISIPAMLFWDQRVKKQI